MHDPRAVAGLIRVAEGGRFRSGRQAGAPGALPVVLRRSPLRTRAMVGDPPRHHRAILQGHHLVRQRGRRQGTARCADAGRSGAGPLAPHRDAQEQGRLRGVDRPGHPAGRRATPSSGRPSWASWSAARSSRPTPSDSCRNRAIRPPPTARSRRGRSAACSGIRGPRPRGRRRALPESAIERALRAATSPASGPTTSRTTATCATSRRSPAWPKGRDVGRGDAGLRGPRRRVEQRQGSRDGQGAGRAALGAAGRTQPGAHACSARSG